MEKVPSKQLVGADIEHFLYDNVQERIVPCVGILPGTKDKPHPLARNGYFVQEDNVMIEYNIPPCEMAEDLHYSIRTARMYVQRVLDDLHGANRYSVFTKSKPSYEFSDDQLDSDQARTIGCEPDFDAYAGGEQRVYRGELGNTRSCGGHIHLGGNFQCPDFVAALFADVYIGWKGSAILLDRNDPRKKWYGRPGVYRPKPYGIEYRSPCNAWSVAHADYTAYYCFDLVKWLTTADPRFIVQAFKNTPWTKIREEWDDDSEYNQYPYMSDAVDMWQTKYGLGK